MSRQPDGNYTIRGPNMNIANWVSLKINFTFVNCFCIISKYFKFSSILTWWTKVFDFAGQRSERNRQNGFLRNGIFQTHHQSLSIFSKFINSFISNSNGIAMNWKQQCDAFVAPFIVDPSRAARMDFTSGLAWTEPYNIVVPKPELRSRLFAFIRPFQPSVNDRMCTIVNSYQFQMNWIGWIRFGWAFCWRLSSWSSSWRSSRGFTKNIRKLKINQTERQHQLELSSATTPSTSSTC